MKNNDLPPNKRRGLDQSYFDSTGISAIMIEASLLDIRSLLQQSWRVQKWLSDVKLEDLLTAPQPRTFYRYLFAHLADTDWSFIQTDRDCEKEAEYLSGELGVWAIYFSIGDDSDDIHYVMYRDGYNIEEFRDGPQQDKPLFTSQNRPKHKIIDRGINFIDKVFRDLSLYVPQFQIEDNGDQILCRAITLKQSYIASLDCTVMLPISE